MTDTYVHNGFFPFFALLGVFVLIVTRRVGRIKLQIWQIMLAGAAFVILSGHTSPKAALSSINLDVMVFLTGMFIIGEAMVASGYLYNLSYRFFKSARNADELILMVLFIMGVFSAFLMNDTVAIIGTPLVIFLGNRYGISNKLLLLTLCFATTVGSVASPIGNPQNLLIAVSGNIPNPFLAFFKTLAAPTVINMFFSYLVLRFFYRGDFGRPFNDSGSEEPVSDIRLALLCKISLALIVVSVFLKLTAVSFNLNIVYGLKYIAIVSALPIVILSPKRLKIIKGIDWRTLVFFAALFVLMGSVWDSGGARFPGYLSGFTASVTNIFVASVFLSQIFSNVPYVALVLPFLKGVGASTSDMVALAAGSTIAGNLFILGAASNVIIVQNAETRGETLTFFEFAKVGVPLTAINMMVYWVFFTFFR